MDDAKRSKFRWTPVMTGLAVSAVSAAVLLAAQFRTESGSSAWLIPAFCLTSGAFAALFHSRRLRALLYGLILGIAVGALSSFGLLAQPVEGLFFMVSSTMLFYSILCVTVGAFLQFVLFLHHLAHGRGLRRRPAPKG